MRIFSKVSLVLFSLGFIFGSTGIVAFAFQSPATVNLGTAGNFVILGKTGISTTGTTAITGDIGVSPIAATAMTGFGLIMDALNTFSTSALVTGKIYAADYTSPTPTTMTTAVSDMQTAYTNASGRPADVTELGAGNIGGMIIYPGVYKWATGVTIPADVTLSGSANDIWIFQIAGTLNISSAKKIILSGGAQAKNIFWQVAGQTTLGTTSVFNGNILGQTAIVLGTGATLNGRALAQTAITLDSNAVTVPTSSSASTSSISSSSSSSSSSTSSSTSSLSSTSSVSSSISTSSSSSTSSVSSSISSSTASSASSSRVFYPTTTSSSSSSSSSSSTASSTSGQQVETTATDLTIGRIDEIIRILQQFLISQNKGPAAEALAKIGATSYFGPFTRAALIEYQVESGITPTLQNF